MNTFNDIFSNYSNGILNFIQKRSFNESAIPIISSQSLGQNIRKMFHKSEIFSDTIGPHPDFSDLQDKFEYHYIVSVFVDIKGSTNLVFKYPNLQNVRYIKDKILSAAIEIFQALDGHIHRLQGDAIFSYFGGKKINISDSVINALNACTLLQEFINSYINPQFENEGIDPIKVRIGIDLGYDKDVLWSKYGIKQCSEITTTSLHTDLAAKLQNKCSVNSILIGENVFNQLDIPSEFISIKTYTENKEVKQDPYIIQRDDFKYKMYVFDWKKYLKSFEFAINNDESDKFNLICHYSKGSKNSERYVSNASSLPKECALKFVINNIYDFNNYNFVWTVINRGTDAKENNAIEPFQMKEFEGKISCLQMTAYKGHHYMKCSIYKNNIKVCDKLFGIFVNNE